MKVLALSALIIGVLLSLAGEAHASSSSVPPGTERAQIVGGRVAQPGTFGMLAYIENNRPDGSTVICSGTVVSADVVLTAGHCGENRHTGVPYPASGFRVVTGTTDLADPVGAQVSAVSQVIVNPGFDPASLQGDAALLVLATPTTAPPVAIAADPADPSAYGPGDFGYIAGWGTTQNTTLPARLHWGTTVLQQPTYCQQQAAALGASFDPGAQFCVQDAPADSVSQCSGDSGGPFLVETAQGLQETGLMSFDQSDCDATQPGFLTSTAPLATWIDSVITAQSTSSGPTPTPLASPTQPSPGLYTGTTTQGYRITFRVSAGEALTGVNLSFRARCTGNGFLAFHYSPVTVTSRAWPLVAAAGGALLNRTFSDSSGETYRLTGTFDGSGIASGTLSSVWAGSQFGNCQTGTLSWRALFSS